MSLTLRSLKVTLTFAQMKTLAEAMTFFNIKYTVEVYCNANNRMLQPVNKMLQAINTILKDTYKLVKNGKKTIH